MEFRVKRRAFAFVGAIGVVVGVGYLFQHSYFQGGIYTLFGVVWILMSTRPPRPETAAGLDGTSSAVPPRELDSATKGASKTSGAN